MNVGTGSIGDLNTLPDRIFFWLRRLVWAEVAGIRVSISTKLRPCMHKYDFMAQNMNTEYKGHTG